MLVRYVAMLGYLLVMHYRIRWQEEFFRQYQFLLLIEHLVFHLESFRYSLKFGIY